MSKTETMQSAAKILKEGLNKANATGPAKSYIDGKRGEAYLMEGNCYIFKKGKLITVYPINNKAVAEEAERQRLALLEKEEKPKRKRSKKPVFQPAWTPAQGLKALTIHQPYCSWLAGDEGFKTYETRSWATDYRGPVAIHAAACPPPASFFQRLRDTPPEQLSHALKKLLQKDDQELIDSFPRGSVVAIGRLVDCHPITKKFIKKLSPQERLLGNWDLGGYAWEFANVVMLEHPIPAKGQQRLWTWRDCPKSVLAAYAKRLVDNASHHNRSFYKQ